MVGVAFAIPYDIIASSININKVACEHVSNPTQFLHVFIIPPSKVNTQCGLYTNTYGKGVNYRGFKHFVFFQEPVKS